MTARALFVYEPPATREICTACQARLAVFAVVFSQIDRPDVQCRGVVCRYCLRSFYLLGKMPGDQG